MNEEIIKSLRAGVNSSDLFDAFFEHYLFVLNEREMADDGDSIWSKSELEREKATLDEILSVGIHRGKSNAQAEPEKPEASIGSQAAGSI